MPKLVIQGAQMKCNLGFTPSKLSVTSQFFKKINNALVATEKDKEGLINIPSFGNCTCSWPNPPCVPSPQQWLQITQKDSINGNKKLTEDSFIMCAKGGKIEFIDTGKNTFVKGE